MFDISSLRTGVSPATNSGSATDPSKKFGFFRAKVVEVDIDNNNFGVIRVFLPSNVTSKDSKVDMANTKNVGQLAYPANSPMGGRNDKANDDNDKKSYYQGSVYVPPKGSWVWCFFEDGNQNKVYYFSSLDIENTKLPPENRLKRKNANDDSFCEKIDDPHSVYTVMKTHNGRCIVVADSEDVQRVEITGKKRLLAEGNESEEDNGNGNYSTGKGKSVAAGNFKSTYAIDDNQTTILLDERDNQEKLLIRTYKGDYINIDITNQKLNIKFKSDIIVNSEGNFSLETTDNVIIKCKKFSVSAENIHLFASGEVRTTSGASTNIKAGGNVNIDGSETYIQSESATTASPDSVLTPDGKRDKES